MKRILQVIFATALLSLATTSIAAPPEGKGKGKPDKAQGHSKHEKKKDHDSHGARVGDALVSIRIGSAEVRRIAVNHKATGYEDLPPGIRKNLARGKPIPPGIAKKAVPPAVLAELPAHEGYEWRVYGSDLVLVSIATAVIADVLMDVFD